MQYKWVTITLLLIILVLNKKLKVSHFEKQVYVSMKLKAKFQVSFEQNVVNLAIVQVLYCIPDLEW